MQIIKDYPPIYEAILGAGMKPTKNTVYTYGEDIYVPNGSSELEDHLIEHERTHSAQQILYPGGPDAWWMRYISDIYFRVDQEAEAYGMQYKFLCKRFKDRNRRNLILNDLGRYLSSPIYGGIVGHQSAMQMIKQKSNVI